MRTRCRFADLIPSQRLDLSAVPRAAGKTQALEDAYTAGFCGAYLPTDDGPHGRAARWYRDEFRDDSGKDRYRFEDAPALTVGDGAEFGYCASKDAYEAYARDQAPNHERWLFEFQQNSGNCVGAAGVEMFAGLFGTRAMDPTCGEVMPYVAAMWAYMFRGSCGQGWYGGAHATVTRRYGYCFATAYDLPQTGHIDYDGEQDSEDLTVRTWCRSQPDDFIAHVKSQGWFFDDDAIYEFSGGIDGLKAMVRAKGQLHHGSNYTSGSSTPDKVKRIGGHMQTMFGGNWSHECLDWYEARGVHFTADDFPCLNHQTWGGGWSGAVSDEYWWPGFGPKPQGAWIVGAKNQLRYFSDGYVYLPKLKGIPGDTPEPPPPVTDHPKIIGTIRSDAGAPIRGVLTLSLTGTEPEDNYHYLVEPAGIPGEYRLTPKYV